MKNKFKNSDLQREVEKHLRADKISLKKAVIDNCGEPSYYLDVNEDGYSYVNKEDRDHDFKLIKQIKKL